MKRLQKRALVDPTTNYIVRLVKNYIYEHKISDSEFARRAGVSKAWLSKLHNKGGELTLTTAEKLLHAAGYHLILKSNNDINSEDKIEYDIVPYK